MSIDVNKGVERRTVLKGAAWSVPVIAVAAATPFAGAAVSGAGVDVQVATTCTGNYDLAGLLGAINAIPGVGALAGQTVQNLLGAIGLTPVGSRGFIITANEGTIPAGTEFNLTPAPGLITLDAPTLAPILTAAALTLVSITSGTVVVKTDADITQGNSVTVDLQKAAVKLTVGGDSTLALVGNDTPTDPANAGANSATLSLVSVDTNLGSLVDLGLLAPLLNTLAITVQLCPGQSI